jgi:plasmid stabilization system protein ParE
VKSAALSVQAELDVIAIVSWYESQRAGLGERFLDSVDATLSTLGARHPRRLYFRDRSDLWWVPIGRWPYYMLFVGRDGDDLLRVFAVTHEAREPGHWGDRLAEFD